jgi:small subunit ribosomal protein S9
MEKSSEKYIETVGRRKTAVARVRITEASKTTITIGEKTVEEYFPTKEMVMLVKQPFAELSTLKFKVTAKIVGGGIHSQAEALRHGIARGIVEYDENFRKTLKKAGYLKRDPRAKERRKFGLKKARKAPQWSKR